MIALAVIADVYVLRPGFLLCSKGAEQGGGLNFAFNIYDAWSGIHSALHAVEYSGGQYGYISGRAVGNGEIIYYCAAGGLPRAAA